MKKLLFCFVFIINVIAFGANVYFLNDGIGYIYTNGQTFYSEQNGRALVLYHIWVDPTKYSVDEWGGQDLKALMGAGQIGVIIQFHRE